MNAIEKVDIDWSCRTCIRPEDELMIGLRSVAVLLLALTSLLGTAVAADAADRSSADVAGRRYPGAGLMNTMASDSKGDVLYADRIAVPQATNAKLDLILRSQITIDHPVKEVWPYFLDMGAWMTGHRFKNIQGRRGEEGEVRLVKPEGNTPYRSYFIKTVRVTPCEQYVVKVTPEDGAEYLGFADFSFTEAGGKTHIIYDIYMELTVMRVSDKEFRKFHDEQYATAHQEVARNNQNLKSLVEAKKKLRSAR